MRKNPFCCLWKKCFLCSNLHQYPLENILLMSLIKYYCPICPSTNVPVHWLPIATVNINNVSFKSWSARFSTQRWLMAQGVTKKSHFLAGTKSLRKWRHDCLKFFFLILHIGLISTWWWQSWSYPESCSKPLVFPTVGSDSLSHSLFSSFLASEFGHIKGQCLRFLSSCRYHIRYNYCWGNP